jgi:hypothetical protein
MVSHLPIFVLVTGAAVISIAATTKTTVIGMTMLSCIN